jgi:hypothetical protein
MTVGLLSGAALVLILFHLFGKTCLSTHGGSGTFQECPFQYQSHHGLACVSGDCRRICGAVLFGTGQGVLADRYGASHDGGAGDHGDMRPCCGTIGGSVRCKGHFAHGTCALRCGVSLYRQPRRGSGPFGDNTEADSHWVWEWAFSNHPTTVPSWGPFPTTVWGLPQGS